MAEKEPKAIAIDVLHSITETDFGDRHSWSLPGVSRDDEATVIGAASKVVADLAKAGIKAYVKVTTYRIPFPAEW